LKEPEFNWLVLELALGRYRREEHAYMIPLELEQP
jgi:hypothetical protein